ncbi:hypothetical protein [Streptosporangium sp. CA-115845]|uniref:hypothetical protein n=1 Tax=Streptosporangium sp. CA-115845 TaxID=3240071 RepID=UPI003D8BD89A
MNVTDLSALAMVAIGPVPPPESVKGLVVVVVDRDPSAFRRNVASSFTQDPSTSLRVGMTDRLRVRVPSGLAVTVSVGVAAPVTSIGSPACLACASDRSTDMTPVRGVAGDGDGAAAADEVGRALRVVANTAATVAARFTRDQRGR